MATLLAQKSDSSTDNAVAKSDDHHDALANDPTVSAFPQGSSFGSTTPAPTTGGFGSATSSTTGGFGSTASTGGFGSSSTAGTSSFGSSSGFGGSSGGFGGSSSFGGSQGGFGGGMNNGMSGGGFGGGMSGGMGGGMSGGMGMGGGYGNNGMMQQQSTAEAANAFGGIMAAQAAAGGEQEHWMAKFWRPAMGWLYMLICFADFVVFPAITMFLPVIDRMFGLQMGYTPWQSLTLSNGGLIHLAFGAILGVSAYGTTKERTK